MGERLSYGPSVSLLTRYIFCEAKASLRLSWPISAEVRSSPTVPVVYYLYRLLIINETRIKQNGVQSETYVQQWAAIAS